MYDCFWSKKSFRVRNSTETEVYSWKDNLLTFQLEEQEQHLYVQPINRKKTAALGTIVKNQHSINQWRHKQVLLTSSLSVDQFRRRDSWSYWRTPYVVGETSASENNERCTKVCFAFHFQFRHSFSAAKIRRWVHICCYTIKRYPECSETFVPTSSEFVDFCRTSGFSKFIKTYG